MRDTVMQGLVLCHDLYSFKSLHAQRLKAHQEMVIILHCRLG